MAEQYDPEKHGDGLTVMVPMDVEPPEGAECYLWGVPVPSDAIYHYFDGEWHVNSARNAELVKSFYAQDAEGWTIRPALPPKPEPVKSYAGKLDCSGRVDVDDIAQCSDYGGEGIRIAPEMIAENPDVAAWVIHFIYDHLSTDEDRAAIIKTLTEGEG